MKHLEEILAYCEAATEKERVYGSSATSHCKYPPEIHVTTKELAFFVEHAITDLPAVTKALQVAVEALEEARYYHQNDKATESIGPYCCLMRVSESSKKALAKIKEEVGGE